MLDPRHRNLSSEISNPTLELKQLTLTPQDSDLSDFLRDWAACSKLLYYTVVCISVVTLPALVFMLNVIRKHSKSTYFCFLAAIIIGNFVLLATIFSNVVSDRNSHLFGGILPGVVVCKLSAFLVNTSSFFVHWAWVAMFFQRFVHVFFPFRSHISGNRSKEIIAALCAFSIISQVWTPILITELSFSSDLSDGTYCAEDPKVFGEVTLKYLIFSECAVTFFLPLLLTVVADISVLIMRFPCNSQFSKFTIITSNDLTLHQHETEIAAPLKIMHKSKILCNERRRTNAFRRCLFLTTTTLLLNLPNYSLQMMDEFYHFRESTDLTVRRTFIKLILHCRWRRWRETALEVRGVGKELASSIFAMKSCDIAKIVDVRGHGVSPMRKADAIVYIIYLLQFPTVPLYMYFLKNDFDKKKLNPKSRHNSGNSNGTIIGGGRVDHRRSTAFSFLNFTAV